MDYEVVFSGRGFLDGRGLSSMTPIGRSTAALVAAEALCFDDDDAPTPRQVRNRRREQLRRERQRARAAAAIETARTSTIDDAPTVCRCGCGGALPPRGHRAGRQRLFLRAHNRTWFQRQARRRLGRPPAVV